MTYIKKGTSRRGALREELTTLLDVVVEVEFVGVRA
jgi:hypothetical protein